MALAAISGGKGMTIGSIIYQLLIGPLELFFEVVFVVANRHVSSPAYAIILLSLAMNFLVLPLYRRADAVQAEVRDRENALAPWIKHIKKTFSGDERFMMLQAYYRQNNYKPTDSLKGSISLLLEIPFFIAAYHFLSHLQTLKYVSFGPISDLGAPDALLTVGGVSINLLPIIMTLINVVSAAIYMKGFPIKSKVQMYGIAAIFLIFLYKSPAGLVFYWTLNNLFSLIKNIFYKLKDPAKVLRILSSVLGLILLVLVLWVHPMEGRRAQIFVVAVLLCMQLPLLLSVIKKHNVQVSIVPAQKADLFFYGSCGVLTVLTGLLIPSAVINDSTAEFVDLTNYVSPFWFIVSALVFAAGTFLVWFGIFYRLASESGRQILGLVVTICALGAVVDYMFFGKSFGNLSADLIYDKSPEIGMKYMLINLLVLLLIAAVVFLVWKKKSSLLGFASVIICAALVFMAGMNMISIHTSLDDMQELINAKEDAPEITLNRDGRNVIVIMMDRQIGRLVPFLLNENAELKEQFDGFTYYKNSISFGSSTNTGSPGLYGGYDYAPEQMNARSEESLVEKQNEALKVMPALFGDAGFDVTICEPTYAGYSWYPDLSIYDDHPEYKCFHVNGKFSMEEYGYEAAAKNQSVRNRDFFCFSLFRVFPAVGQRTLYDGGNYNAQPRSSSLTQKQEGKSVAFGYNGAFMKAYAVLYNLPEITTVTDGSTDTFLMMSNDTTHEPATLQEPEYIPALEIDNTTYDEAHPDRTSLDGEVMSLPDDWSLTHYQVNMAAMVQLGKWFDYMREEGVYDNTRIIIVSDHGALFGDDESNKMHYINYNDNADYLDVHAFNCVLLVKDFNATGFVTEEQMATNADTPALAAMGLIDNPVNPFTGNKIRRLEETTEDIHCIRTYEWDVSENSGTTFEPDEWFMVQRGTDIFDANNWKYIGHK